MEDISKKNVILVFLDENNSEKAIHIEELILNDSWVSYKTKDNWVTIPIARVIKIKEEVER